VRGAKLCLRAHIRLATLIWVNVMAQRKLGPEWFAVSTSPRHEKRVDLHLIHRGIEHYLPLYRTEHKWRNGLRAHLELPLFPGYIFARFNRSERVRVLEVPGVLAIVTGTGHEIAPLPEDQIDALRLGLPMSHAEPHTFISQGPRGRIRSGALAGMKGFVVQKENALRVVFNLDLIMKSVAVKVEKQDLELIDFKSLSCS